MESPGSTYFNAQRGSGLTNLVLQPLIHDVGESAKLLQRRRRADGQQRRRPLLPGSLRAEAALLEEVPATAATGATAFHQDFITFAVDRSGGMTFWFPLEAYGPDAGTMSFINGSNRAGILGDYTTYGGGDALDAFPELRQLGMSEQISYEVGDISVHTHLTVHGAGPNLMDRPRWAYIVITQPADVCWNGSPCPNFDSSAMKPWEPFGDERFPVIN